MRSSLSKIPLFAWFGKIGKRFNQSMSESGIVNRKSLLIKIAFAIFAVGMCLVFNEARQQFIQATGLSGTDGMLEDLSLFVPLAGKGFGAFLAVLALLVSLWYRDSGSEESRKRVILISLWIASVGALFAWLPADVITTQGALAGKALAGENPSIPAYMGNLVLITFLILSPPIAAQFFFRLDLMDQYVVKAFMGPFFFCMMAFTSIWLIFDFTDNGSVFSGLPFSRLLQFYVVQFPFVILFVLPIVILLSLLFALSKMSKSNELISMIGAGRSVLRILAPLFFIGVYTSLIALALKYDWAPRSVGLKEAIFMKAHAERAARLTGKPLQEKGLVSRTGWMHVNDYGSRTWFVGRVPLNLSDPMGNVIIWKRDEDGQPVMMWKARSASWDWQSDPSEWTLTEGIIYRFEKDKIPRMESFESLVLTGWNETPWKVLSSSQNPEFLGLPGLVMYLNANREMAAKDLAAFRTNRWNIFAEPATCLAMVLVAAPLGIVYSRKGVLGGVTAAVVIFALMYIMKGTTMALGQGNRIFPFFGAWTCNFFVAGLGVILLWFRSRNRPVPTLKSLLGSMLPSKSQ